MKVYFNGRLVDEEAARVSIDDRGFLFADGVYEVVHVYNGRLFAWEAHLARLKKSLEGIGMTGAVSPEELTGAASELLAAFTEPEGALYLQITRGVQKRSHAPPPPGEILPTVLMWVRPVAPFERDFVQAGVSVITVPDDRWAKVWIKTVGLLPNVLAKGKAQAAGAFDAVFVRDGMVTEATAANVFIVREGRLQTAPVTNYILPGITREVVLDLAREMAVPVDLIPFSPQEMMEADEVFLTGTLTEVLPVTEIDGHRVAQAAGPLAFEFLRRLHSRAGKVW